MQGRRQTAHEIWTSLEFTNSQADFFIFFADFYDVFMKYHMSDFENYKLLV